MTPIKAGATSAKSPVTGIGNNCVIHRKMQAKKTASALNPWAERPSGGVVQ